MKLKVTRAKANPVVGIHAGIMKDDINGSSLVLQSGADQIQIKLSDIIELINLQESKEEDAKLDETK